MQAWTHGWSPTQSSGMPCLLCAPTCHFPPPTRQIIPSTPPTSSCSYCKPKCPALEAPPTGTNVAFLFEGQDVNCLTGPCNSGTVARYSCSPRFAFSNQLAVRGGFKTMQCTSGSWSAGVAPCVETTPMNSWVISTPGASCDTACEAQSMGCSVENMQAVTTAAQITSALGSPSALPGLTCAAGLTVDPTVAPALDRAANTCAQGGIASTCESGGSATVQRLW